MDRQYTTFNPNKFDIGAIDHLLMQNPDANLDNSKKTNSDSLYPIDYRLGTTPNSTQTGFKPYSSTSPTKKFNQSTRLNEEMTELDYYKIYMFLMAIEIERLNTELTQSYGKNAFESTQKQIESLTKAIEHWRLKYEQKEEELDDLRRYLLEQNDVQNQLSLAESENNMLKNEINYLKKQLGEIEKTNDKNKQYTDDLKEKDREIKRLSNEINRLREENFRFTGNFDKQQQDKIYIDQVLNENKKLMETIRNLEKKNDEMRRELISLKNDIEKLSETPKEQPKLGKEFMQLKQYLNDFIDKKLRDEFDELQSRYNQLSNEYQRIKKNLSQIKQSESNTDSEQAARLQRQLDKLQNLLNQTMNENNRLKEELLRNKKNSNVWCC